MKKLICIVATATVLAGYCACRNSGRVDDSKKCNWNYDPHDSDWGQPFLSVSEADTMIKSYLTSINYQSEDSNVRSFIIDANALRKYLLFGDGKEISKMKIMLAHNKDYIADGQFGKPCGYSNKALTVVLVGFGDEGNYIYAPNNKVMDYSMPCPKNCPVSGDAASDILPN